MYDSLQRGTFVRRAFVSHQSLSKSAQFLRNSSELVCRVDSADTWSNALEHGESVAKVNDQSSQKLEPQEVDSSVQTPRRNDHAAGDRLRSRHIRFEELSNAIQITKACKFAGFMRRVSIGNVLQNCSRCE